MRLSGVMQVAVSARRTEEPSPGTNQNSFLSAIPGPVRDRVSGDLEAVPFRRGAILAHPGDTVRHLYFPDRGLIALAKVLYDGQMTEVGAVGTEGMIGISALLGMTEAAFESVVEIDGCARRLDVDVLRSELGDADIRKLAQRYLHYEISGLGQMAACNRLHRLEQRCCRWLLTARDSAQSSRLAVTHEFLALMMGVHRPALSSALEGLKRKGLIAIERAAISILDPFALEGRSCECYGSIKRELDRVYGLGGDENRLMRRQCLSNARAALLL